MCSYTSKEQCCWKKNRHLLDNTRALMIHMYVPKCFWGDTVLTAYHLINRVLLSVLDGKTSFSVLYPKNNSLIYQKIFGCMCFVQLEKEHDKLDPRIIRCVYKIIFNTKKILMLESRQQKVCNLCGCHFFWNHTLLFSLFGFH